MHRSTGRTSTLLIARSIAAGVTVKALYAALVAYGRQLRHNVDLNLASFVRRHLGLASPALRPVHADSDEDWSDSQRTAVDEHAYRDDVDDFSSDDGTAPAAGF